MRRKRIISGLGKASSVTITAMKYEKTVQVGCHGRAGCVCANDFEPLQQKGPPHRTALVDNVDLVDFYVAMLGLQKGSDSPR